MIEGWLRNNGSAIVSDDLKTPTINSPENVETIQFLQDLIYKYGYAPIPEPNVDPIQQLMDGTVAMGSFGRWPTLSYQANDFKDAYVTKVPKFSTQQTMFGIGGVAVTSEKNYEEAAKFALWCAQDTFVKGYLSAGGIPANKAIADEIIPTEYDPENSQLFYASLKDAVPIGAPASYAEIDSIVTSALSDIFMNKADVKTTLDNAAQQMAAAMRDAVEGRARIKAAGGIRTLDALLALEEAGCSRFGIGVGSAVSILREAWSRAGKTLPELPEGEKG